MKFLSFNVACRECGHVNRPANKVSDCVLEVLSGSFTTCKNCKSEFSIIMVPNRPNVKKFVDEGLKISPKINIYDYTGRVPMAQGFI